jgi:uncharacterized membrane protein
MSEARFRWFVIGLLVLNLFFVGAVAGGAVMWVRQAGEVQARWPLAGEDLPDKDRAAFRAALNETRRAAHDTILESQQGRIDAASLLGQPTLDQAALSAALAQTRNADVAVRALVEQRAVAFAATLPVEERRRLAEGLVRREAPKAPASK